MTENQDDYVVDDVGIFNAIVSQLKQLDREGQLRMLHTVETFLGLPADRSRSMHVRSPSGRSSHLPSGVQDEIAQIPFSAEESIEPKDFLREKAPHTDVERMVCLAYYLSHYLNVPEFKTLDLTKLNTKAAQPKFTNAARTAANALQYGYFAQGQKKGHRQLSAAGEEYVLALPDRAAAKTAMARARPKWKRRTKKNDG